MDNREYEEYFKYLKKRSKLALIYRYFWLYPKINRYLNGRVIDIGCGIGDFLAFRPNTIGVDINPLNIKYCHMRNLEAIYVDKFPYPFKNGEFDSALLDNVLEHIENPFPLLKEIYRLLKPYGCLVVGIPGTKGYLHDKTHVCFYNEDKLIDIMKKSQFKCKLFFYTPFRSSWLDKNFCYYCVYGVFIRQSFNYK